MTYYPRVINRATNPSAELNTNGWGSYTAGITSDGIVSSANWSRFGDRSFMIRITGAATSGNRFISMFTTSDLGSPYLIPAEGDDVISVSAYLRIFGGANTYTYLQVLFRDKNGNEIGSRASGAAVASSNGLIYRATVENFVTPTGTVAIAVSAAMVPYSGEIPADTNFYLDGLMVNDGPVALPYVDGDIPMQSRWYGTPHASGSEAMPVRVNEAPEGQFPGTRNLFPFPSAEDSGASDGKILGYAAGVTSPELNRSSAWSWSGEYSYRFAYGTSNASTTALCVFTADQRCVSDRHYSASARVRPSFSGLAYIVLRFRASPGGSPIASYQSEMVPITGGQEDTLRIEACDATVEGAYYTIEVWYRREDGGSIGDTRTLHVDAIQMNEGNIVHPYTDGDQGTGYQWFGTPHASPSYSAAIAVAQPTGQGGTMQVTSRLFLTDKSNRPGTDITEHLLDGSIEMNIDRDGPKSTIKVGLIDLDIENFSWVAPYIRIEYEDGTADDRQVGLFRLEQPRDVFDNESVETDMTGYDALIVAADYQISDNMTITTTYPITSYIVAWIEQTLGMRANIPASSKLTTSAGMSWPPGTSLLEIINDCCAAVGYYSVWADNTGVITTQPIIASLASVQPKFFYAPGHNSQIVGRMSFDPSDNSIFNFVTVFRDDPAKGTILKASRGFDDPNSPIAIRRLGIKAHTFSLQEAADQAAVDAEADRLIQERTMYVNGNLEIMPSLDHTPHETIDLDLSSMADVPNAQKRNGRYYVKSYTLPLSPGTMKLGIRRIERFD